MAGLYNFDMDKIGNTQGMRFKIVGYKTKAPKMPWIVVIHSPTLNTSLLMSKLQSCSLK